jgi:hypothetical protein
MCTSMLKDIECPGVFALMVAGNFGLSVDYCSLYVLRCIPKRVGLMLLYTVYIQKLRIRKRCRKRRRK